MKKRFVAFAAFFCAALFPLYAQEVLVSVEANYYDFLALQGMSERPALNYHTLSDAVWNIDEAAEHPWQGLNLGTTHKLFGNATMRIYGPELFTSYNTAAPYCQNDGALWQGKGFNTSLTGGVRFEGYGVELTFKPQLAFSQNAAFDYIQPNYSGTNYADKAAIYGYYGIGGIDAPQRFGDGPFFTYDWGDSEVRYSWKTLTVGFGTQAIWLGPAQLNPIIHSNNAPSYPKLDIGLRRQSMTLPWLNWYIGDIEARAWWGYLSESEYFDNDSSNDHNLITGFSIAYAFPGVLKGLSLGLNRTMLSEWDEMNYGAVFILLWPFMEGAAGSDRNDQRASVVVEYLLPAAGINVYLEWGKNDFSPSLDDIIRYPFHTEGYTMGIKKAFSITNYLKGELLFEISNFESSRDYELMRSTTFYAHHIITQGYTNQGQWLGAGIGTGGNSQYLGFKLYYPKGYGHIFVQRSNPDLDYTWFIDSKKYPNGNADNFAAVRNMRAFLDIGISTTYSVIRNLRLSGSIVFRDEHNPQNEGEVLSNQKSDKSLHRYNIYISFGLAYIF